MTLFLLTSVNFLVSWCASEIGNGMNSGVSLEAYPIIIPWSPAPTSSAPISPRTSSAWVTPLEMSVDCSSKAIKTEQPSQSNP